jgi:hypothetical protein
LALPVPFPAVKKAISQKPIYNAIKGVDTQN